MVISRSRNNHYMVLAAKFMLIAIAILLFSCEYASAVKCDDDIVNLATKCKNFVLKEGKVLKPSGECCAVVKKANVPCLCSHVTKQIEEFISMKKVFFVAKSCGKKVAPGTKCGSYTVPSA